jgi:hypothetical protein
MKLRKAMWIIFLVTLVAGLVTAGLMTYMNKVKTNIMVEQSVVLDGVNYDKLIIDNVTGIGGNTMRRNHTLNVRCDVSVNLTITTTNMPGILVFYQYYENTTCHSVTNPQLFEPGIYNIIFCYQLDLNLKPATYAVTSTLSIAK